MPGDIVKTEHLALLVDIGKLLNISQQRKKVLTHGWYMYGTGSVKEWKRQKHRCQFWYQYKVSTYRSTIRALLGPCTTTDKPL